MKDLLDILKEPLPDFIKEADINKEIDKIIRQNITPIKYDENFVKFINNSIKIKEK